MHPITATATLLLTLISLQSVTAITPKSVFDDMLPPCARDCAYKASETTFNCAVEDAQCFCTVEGDPTELYNTMSEEMSSCIQESECTAEDVEGMDFGDLTDAVEDLGRMCEGVVADQDEEVPEDAAGMLVPGKGVVVAGVLVLLAVV
ncbi:hypothetical protein BJY04DRAFT_216511 [Aspergillus karnatakaensis]|uniref:CFEM domain-containing protein n=1 Tax=Aspergillus karnatakaensis TaxID=1810916 RepID=UPI003CCCE8D9